MVLGGCRGPRRAVGGALRGASPWCARVVGVGGRGCLWRGVARDMRRRSGVEARARERLGVVGVPVMSAVLVFAGVDNLDFWWSRVAAGAAWLCCSVPSAAFVIAYHRQG